MRPRVARTSGLLDRPLEASGELRQGDKDVAEAVPRQALAAGEAVLEQLRHQGSTSARAARHWRKSPGGGCAGRASRRAPAVVAHGEHGGQLHGQLLEPPQERGRPVPPPMVTTFGPRAWARRRLRRAAARASGSRRASRGAAPKTALQPEERRHQQGLEAHEQQTALQAGHELQGEQVGLGGERGRAVQVGQDERQPQGHQGHEAR